MPYRFLSKNQDRPKSDSEVYVSENIGALKTQSRCFAQQTTLDLQKKRLDAFPRVEYPRWWMDDEDDYQRAWPPRPKAQTQRPGRAEDVVPETDEEGRAELRSGDLERYLASCAPRRLLGAELRQRIGELFAEARPEWPQDENQSYRVVVCWRIARIMARVCGICAEDEGLDDTTNLVPEPWLDGLRPTLNPLTQTLIRRQSSVSLLNVYGLIDTRHQGIGVPLIPTGDLERAERWVAATEIIVRDTGMDHHEAGVRGLQGMLDPRTAVHAAVTRKQIVELEDLMVDEAQRFIIDSGERPAMHYFRLRHGFTRNEAVGLMRLARAEALRMGGSSVDENRAIMVSQLKDFVTRAKGAMSLGEELRALKELAKVQGLTQAEPEDVARDFLNVISRVVTRQERVQIQAAAPKIFDIKKEPIDEETEDTEAIDAFDRENL
jgi:hypothetical protein